MRSEKGFRNERESLAHFNRADCSVGISLTWSVNSEKSHEWLWGEDAVSQCPSSPRVPSQGNQDRFLSHLQRSSACIGLSTALRCPQRYPRPWFPDGDAGAGQAPSRPKATQHQAQALHPPGCRRGPTNPKPCECWVQTSRWIFCGVATSGAAR